VRTVSPAVPWSVVEVRPGEFEVSGEIDAHSAPNLAAQLADHVACRPVPTLVLDLSGVTFMDSSGLRLVVALHHDALSGGPGLVIRDPSRPVARLFEIAGLSDVFFTRQD
jgi:anti-anti-sigma factor